MDCFEGVPDGEGLGSGGTVDAVEGIWARLGGIVLISGGRKGGRGGGGGVGIVW